MSHTDVSLAEFDKNISKAYTLDKHNDDILSLNSLEQIYEEAKAKKFYGNIIWPAKLPYQNEAIANKIEQIENVIGENNFSLSVRFNTRSFVQACLFECIQEKS